MRTIIFHLLTFTIICSSASPLLSQGNTNRIITLSGTEINSCQFDSLPGTVLFATCNGRSMSLPIDSIAQLIHYINGSYWGAGTGFLIGGAIGAHMGKIIYENEKPEPFNPFDVGSGFAAFTGGIIGGGGGFFLGAIIVPFSSHVDTCDLISEKTMRGKRRILLQIFIRRGPF